MKRILFFVQFLLFSVGAFAQVNVNGVTVSVSSEQPNSTNPSKYNLNTCNESFVTFALNNTTGSPVSSFSIATQANADVLVLYSQLIDANLSIDVANRTIVVLSLPIGSSTIKVPIKASCENFKSTTHSSVSTLNFSYTNATQTQTQSTDFIISSGVIDYISSDDTNPGQNISYTGHKGDVFTRIYNFKTTENSFNGILHMEEIIPSSPSAQIEVQSLELFIDGASKWVRNNNLVDPLTNKLIQDIILNNILTGSIIEIKETVKIIGCPTATGKLTFTYGCEASSCIPLRQMDVATNLGPDRPDLTIKDMNPFDYGTCLASPNNVVRRRFRVQNEGRARANNVYTSPRGGTPSVFPVNIVPLNSVTVTGKNAQVQANIVFDPGAGVKLSDKRGFETNSTTTDVCFDDDLLLFQEGTIRVLVLEPGEWIDVEWEERTCCVSNDLTNNYTINDYGLMATACDNECGGQYGTSTNYWFTSEDYGNMTGVNQIEMTGINNMFGCFSCTGGCGSNPAGTCDDLTLNNPLAPSDYTETLRIKNNGFKLHTANSAVFFPLDYKTFKLVIDFAVDGKLLLAPQTSASRGNIVLRDGAGNLHYPVSQTVLSTTDITSVFGTTDLPVGATDAGARAVFEFDPEVIFGVGTDMTTYRSWGLEIKLQSFINSLETSFEVSGVCGRTSGLLTASTGPSNYFEKMYLVPDGDDCADCKLAIGSYSDRIIVNCPGCVFPGVLVQGYDIERITVGELDADNNGLQDAVGIVATGSPNLKMVTDNDIFKAKTTTTLWSGTTKTYGSGSVVGSLEQDPGFSTRFLTNFGRLDKIGPHGDLMDVVVSIEHPITVDYTQGGNTHHIVFTDNDDGILTFNGTGDFLIQFPIALIRQKLQLPQFNYEANDRAEITIFYKVKPDFDLGSKYYESVDVSTRCFYTDRVKDILVTDESNPLSPYGISGSLKSDQASELKPYLNYVCEAYGSGFILADIKENFTFFGAGAGNQSACIKGLGFRQTVSGNQEGNGEALDLFPYEIRTFSRVDKMMFIIPRGYKLDYSKSLVQNNISYRQNGKFDYISFFELKYLKDFSSQLISKGNAFENDLSGQPVLVGEKFEINIEYNNQLKYRTQILADQFSLGVNDKFSDANEFLRQYMYLEFIPDCTQPILDYVEYSDDLAYIATANWVDYNKYFIIEGPKAFLRHYDNDKQVFSTNQTISKSTTSKSWYNRPSAALWGSSAATIVSLTKVVANVDIFKKLSKIPFKLTSTDQSANVFMYFTTKNGKVILGDLIKTNSDNTTTLFQKVQGVYQLGNLTAGQIFDFNLEVQFQCNNIKDDELYLHVGYTCDNSYPTYIDGVLDKVPCGIMNESIRIIESNADMSVNYNSTATCTNISHELKMESLKDGGLYDFKPTVQLPQGINFISGSAKLLAYDVVGGVPVAMKDISGLDIVFTLSDPIINTTTNALSWDLTNLVGLDDLFFHVGGYALLKFDSDPTCGLTNAAVNASVVATTYCNVPISKLASGNIAFDPTCGPTVTISGATQTCPSTPGILTAQVTGLPTGTAQYTWYTVENDVRTLIQGPNNNNTYTYSNLSATTTFEVDASSSGSTCSATKSITVTVHPLPVLTITAPVEFCIGSAPTVLKGLPAGGTFAGFGVSLTSGVYTFSRTAAGSSLIYYTYTDPLTGCTASKTHTIVVSACCKYALKSVEVMCSEDAVRCITLQALKPVDNGIKGMDFTLRYERNLMRPRGIPGRGNATLGNVVLNGGMTNGMAGYAMSERTIAGTIYNELNVSIYYTGQAPVSADFDGIGDVICIEFDIKGSATAGLFGQTKSIFIGDIYGGAFSQGYVDDEHTVSMIRSCVENNGAGVISILKNNFLNGRIYYHNDENAPLRFDATTLPSPYLMTTIKPITTYYGTSFCTPSNKPTQTPDINGAFSIDMTGTNGLKIERNIAGDYYNSCTDPSDVIDQSGNVFKNNNPADLLLAINGFDTYLMESISTLRSPADVVYVSDRKVPGVVGGNTNEATKLFPTVFQMIAADVNMDRMVRGVDITLVQQRAVSKLCEYPQVWNYNLGVDPAVYPLNTADQRSLDWRFIDKNQVSGNLSYRRSSQYPSPAGNSGTAVAYYWRDNVPSPGFCMMAPYANQNNCKAYTGNFDIHAIMLGDIDGSWRANINNAQQHLRTASERKVVLNVNSSQQVGVNTYRVPVSFVSLDPTTVSLDFALDYKEDKISVKSIGNLAPADKAEARVIFNDFEKKQLLFSSYTMLSFENVGPLYYIDFEAKDGKFNANDLGTGDAYLNGEHVPLRIEGQTTTGTEDIQSDVQYGFNVYPNPMAEEGEITYNIKPGTEARIVVYNTLGQVITEVGKLKGQGNIQVGATEWSAGMYHVILYTEGAEQLVKKWVIQK